MGSAFFIYLAALVFAHAGAEDLFGMNPEPFAALPLIFVDLPLSFRAVGAALLNLPVWVGQIVVALRPLTNFFSLSHPCFGLRDKA
ncbi:hypothetical protein [Boseongicola aestuarii]|uniref:Uncharacterized protein n=1 Tax=Boseongicola aestuarii TaxID=1470561 RepID=A0A238IVD2_9RHOB|nr:hypothetical protein [Boseongicola aestuarii]SMX22337.1 hypothetical protein BOA8489_00429 [Boseongicola aestuarii]